ncbi:hydroxyacylglutathione hydrolase [Marinobacter daqiaonensis]|uniref:Hydroxyacylglutathione hydrolase n=1 Tax=Marinobacter daqiaonensis TaxID=650891 RepID=A0A1I6IB62_9GAMM|nr:MBL fold metallo-hydrolase [Marinobacter daqiaonensis]SFR63987.1 hydroxyacylglutathione hydrolase [Marinobacter daqiaonensis]
MFIQKIKSEGLSHLSYLVGNKGKAFVIDPRRDCEIYMEEAAKAGCRITHVFETHRNEDLISGAPILAKLTGARVLHGPNAMGDVTYADTTRDGDTYEFGNLTLQVLETPGHTDDSLSFAVFDTDHGDGAVGVFTGDALFIGDVGRTDFYPDRAEEVAGLLYDSLQKILALGDQAILYPAHGAGSVCGDNMADREFSSLGYERQYNDRLRIDSRERFIKEKIAEHHYQPPYFRLMEKLNLTGADPAPRVTTPVPLSPNEFHDLPDTTAIIDVRTVSAFLGAHLPGSLAIPAPMIPAFAGWYIEPGQPVVLVAADPGQAREAAQHLIRIGLDNLRGFLTTDMPEWSARGLPFHSLPAMHVDDIRERFRNPPENWQLLDVRSITEYEEEAIDGSVHVYVGELPEQLDRLDGNRHYTVMCASGARATIAASVLERAGFSRVDVFLGSFGAWKSRD